MAVMNFQFVIAISLQITSIFSKKHDTSSEESIENILFYKDYRPKQTTTTTQPVIQRLSLPERAREPECVPRMCCSMSCTDSCGPNEMSNRQNQNMNSMASLRTMNSMSPMNSMNSMNPMNSMNSMNSMSSMNSMNSMNPMMSMPMHQSSRLISPFTGHKKKMPTLPFSSRKSFGSTREHIKSLISKDEDIKKILKDLVRVTMKKVDLLEMIKTRRAQENENRGLLDDDDDEREL